MIPLSILIAAVAIVFALRAKPGAAVGILICSMMLYPDYLRVPIGPIKMSVPRFVALALILKFWFSNSKPKIKWTFIDGLIWFEWIWTIAANLMAGSQQTRVNEMIGRIFDSVLMYYVARTYLSSTEDFRAFARPLLWCVLIVGSLGIIESITGKSPYSVLVQYSAISGGFGFETIEVGADAGRRFGLLRAAVACSTPIYFGMAMTMITAILYSMRGFVPNKGLWLVGCVVGLLGSIGSMSSGPQSALIVFTVVIVMERFPTMIKPALIAFIGFLIFCEFASNRHVWYLIEYINPAGGDSFYRSQLITVAIQQWRDYWLVGVGDHGVNHWGPMIDGRLFTDIVNEYVLVAVGSGLLGLVCRLGIQISAIRRAISAYRSGTPREKKLAYGLAGTLIAIMVGGLSVGCFGPQLLLMYLLLGMMVWQFHDSTGAQGTVRRRFVRRISKSENAVRFSGTPDMTPVDHSFRSVLPLQRGPSHVRA